MMKQKIGLFVIFTLGFFFLLIQDFSAAPEFIYAGF